MLKALCILVGLTGWGHLYPLGAAGYSVATYENQYYEILRLHRESQRLPESERSERAVALADKVLRAYESVEYLSFTHETVDFWCTEGAWRSYLPMECWPKEAVATAHVAMTPDKVHTEISVGGRPLYSVFVKDMRMTEYRWPWDGMPGEYTSFPYNPVLVRLCKGVDPHITCLTATLRRPWVGDVSKTAWFKKFQELRGRATNQPRNWQGMIGQGQWVGSAKEQGQVCEVVLLDQEDIDRRDVFFINQQGFVALRYIIIRETDNPQNKWIVVTWHRDYQAGPIPESEFSPSEALREIARNWRKLTEAEAQAEHDEAHAGP